LDGSAKEQTMADEKAPQPKQDTRRVSATTGNGKGHKLAEQTPRTEPSTPDPFEGEQRPPRAN
jgi:hypothetical protein